MTTTRDELMQHALPPDPSLADLLEAVARFLRRFVVFSNQYQAVAAALWIAHCFAIGAMPAAAYLRIKSAAEESGKTTLIEVLELLLGDRGVNAVSITPAAVYRFRDKVGPVALLLDEIDNTLRNRQDDGARDLLALVNAGYRRSATAIRTSGREHEPKRYSAFGPAAIAGIGHLHPTTESRCIPIVLTRKPRGEGERWIRHLIEEEGEWIAGALERWATDETLEQLRAATPEIVEELRDRHVETWWGLWSIADLAGGEWPSRAREAARALHLDGDEADAMSVGVLLLAHVRDAFDEAEVDRLPTTDLIRRLVEMEEGPWGKWWGPELERAEVPRAAAVDVARNLRAFIGPHDPGDPKKRRPRVIKTPGGTYRGYLREWFEDAWVRYLPLRNERNGRNPTASEVTPVTPVTVPHPESDPEEHVTDVVQALLAHQLDGDARDDPEAFVHRRRLQGVSDFTISQELESAGVSPRLADRTTWSSVAVERLAGKRESSA